MDTNSKCMYLKVMHYVNNILHGKKCVYGLGMIDAPSDVKNVFIAYRSICIKIFH